ncbi:hypothetical protein RQM65_04800 [Pricia sp. S334]|uniref:Uncharacterized protein n=1 Tax=Pricia mediterranea TaxID=3076079 RepID=A0ABU3L2K7_9FLAO|nr:hypothetical protein [Pricia sp. S334]MDT7827981.1 hypothetical protein [Pricia sp. S334]
MNAFDFFKKKPFDRLQTFSAKTRLKRPEPWVLVNAGVFMLSLYGSLTKLPGTLGVISLISLLISSAVGIFRFLRTV